MKNKFQKQKKIKKRFQNHMMIRDQNRLHLKRMKALNKKYKTLTMKKLDIDNQRCH